jgi:hypothetical protein
VDIHRQSRREAIAVAFFVLASSLLWAGAYGLSKINHASRTYLFLWLGSTYVVYMISVLIWRGNFRKRRRKEPEPEPEYLERNPPPKLPPLRL